jgi:hypothetical protein
MIKEAINRLLELAVPNQIEHQGIKYVDKQMHPILPPKPAALNVVTLTGFMDYVHRNVDELVEENVMIHVVNFYTVVLIEALDDYEKRTTYIKAQLPDNFMFNDFERWWTQEEAVISLQKSFVQTEARDNLLRIIGNLSSERVQKFSDDGVTQKVNLTAGTTLINREAETVPNPVKLAPYRTFREIIQPESDFILRVKDAKEDQPPLIAIFEADGGMWELEAMRKIAESITADLKAYEMYDIPVIA